MESIDERAKLDAAGGGSEGALADTTKVLDQTLVIALSTLSPNIGPLFVLPLPPPPSRPAFLSRSSSSLTQALASTISQLPELQEKKRLIDAHMNIATELLGHIRSRSIDSYYAIEESLMEGRSLSRDDKQTLPQLLAGAEATPSTLDDRVRLLLLLHLHPGLVPKADVKQYETDLRDAGADLRAYAYLQKMDAFASAVSSHAQLDTASQPSTTGGRMLSRAMQLADQVRNASVVMLTSHAPRRPTRCPCTIASPSTHSRTRLSSSRPRRLCLALSRAAIRLASAPTCAQSAQRSRRASRICCPPHARHPSPARLWR